MPPETTIAMAATAPSVHHAGAGPCAGEPTSAGSPGSARLAETGIDTGVLDRPSVSRTEWAWNIAV
jgi:hypothetical protein